MKPGGAVGALVAVAVLVLAVAAAGEGGRQRPALTIVDSLGRTVALAAKPARIISLEPESTRIIVALGAGESLVGIDAFLSRHDHLFPLVFPQGRRLPVVSNQGQELLYEEAARLRPDLIIVSPSEFGAAEAVEKKMRVPVAALASMGRITDLLAEIGTLGRVLGRGERAVELVSYLRSRLDDAGRDGPPDRGEKRPSVYLAFWGSLVRTPVSYEPVDAAGGRNIAAGLVPEHLGAPAATISIEKLLAWDPDVILVQGNYPPEDRQMTVDSILGDPRLSSLKAVRSGRVHYTFGFWYWWDPALVVVETLYLARLIRGGALPAGELVRTGDEVFRDVYGVEGAFGALCRVLECHAWAKR